ncbi:MAG: extracellular solute-binding protein [Patescibacteria group bacterium]
MKVTPFQIIVLALFAVSIVAGVIVLATSKTSNKAASIAITVWGTMPAGSFNAASKYLDDMKSPIKITYIEKKPELFDSSLIEALASGVGPDAIVLPQDLIIRYRDKIIPIPFTSMSLPTFKSLFIEEGELYVDASGIVALPFSIDPLVMYWNRDMLSNAGVALPPRSWDEFIALVPKLTVKDQNQNILKSGLAFGEVSNITNAKEIISTLLMQTGNPITAYGPTRLESRLAPATIGSVGAINFYTDFANPIKPDYSWNRALPNSKDVFSAGDLAFYFGFASEISQIRNKNPNLNFDVTYFPQPKGATVSVTFGKMQGLAVLRNSRNTAGAFQGIISMTGIGPIDYLARETGMPPVLRSLLVANPSDPYQSVFYSSAVRAKAWLDPNPAMSKTVFQNMIESITGGELDVGRAINLAGDSLNRI